ncbi:hypothetical protein ScPMuIL_007147 [Solemya velum]
MNKILIVLLIVVGISIVLSSRDKTSRAELLSKLTSASPRERRMAILMLAKRRIEAMDTDSFLMLRREYNKLLAAAEKLFARMK